MEGRLFHWQSIVQVVTDQWGEVSENKQKGGKDTVDKLLAQPVGMGVSKGKGLEGLLTKDQ